MNLDRTEIAALSERFHIRAKALSRKARASSSSVDITRLTAMAVALQWAAQELAHAATHSESTERLRCVAKVQS